MAVPMKLVVDCATGKQELVPLDADELAQQQADQAAATDELQTEAADAQRATQAVQDVVAANDAYLSIKAPTVDEIAAQVATLTEQMNGLLEPATSVLVASPSGPSGF